MCLHRKIYNVCTRAFLMPYTEIKKRNSRKYFYRVVSVREGDKIKKKRKYLGVDLNSGSLSEKEAEADKMLVLEKKDKSFEKIKSKILPILKKNNVKKAGIFGSYSKGLQKKNSDIDIVIEPPKKAGFGFVEIKFELEDKLGKKIDLITYKSIHPLLRKKILSEEERIL